jgi:transcriptional regulator with XRE-family HTH domain
MNQAVKTTMRMIFVNLIKLINTMEKNNLFPAEIYSTTIVHHGQNIKRLRSLFNIQQKEMAKDLGSGWTQKKISHIESMARVSKPIRLEISRYFKVDIAFLNDFTVQSARFFLQHWLAFDKQLKNRVEYNPAQLQPVALLLDEAVKTLEAERERVQNIYELLLGEQLRTRGRNQDTQEVMELRRHFGAVITTLSVTPGRKWPAFQTRSGDFMLNSNPYPKLSRLMKRPGPVVQISF